MKVKRNKKRKKDSESLAIDPNLVKHLKEYIEWLDVKKGALFQGSRGRTCDLRVMSGEGQNTLNAYID